MAVSINKITNWIGNSGLVEKDGQNKGGVHSYFDQNQNKFGFLYPEITGYFISTQRFLFETSNDQLLIENARNSADWLIGIIEKFGGIIQGINTEKSRGTLVYTFDTAICANAFLDCYLLTKNEKYLNFSKSLSRWIINEALEADGTLKPYQNLDTKNFEEDTNLWYKQKGCLHVKVAIPLIRLYDVTKDENFLNNSSLICNSIKKYQKSDGSILLHSNEKIIHLHSLCYALEGLLHCYGVTKNEEYLKNCIRCLQWCQSKMEKDGSTMLWYNSKYPNAKTSYHTAQLVRLMILVDLATKSHEFSDSIEKSLSFLASLQAIDEDSRINGGFYEEYYKTHFGWKIRKRVNSWGSFFALQATHWNNNLNSLSFEHEISFLF